MSTLLSLALATILDKYCEAFKSSSSNSNKNGSNILMITLAGTKSHKIPFLELAHGLIARGHNITFVNAFPSESLTYNLEEIHPLNLELYVRNFTNWDLLGPKLKGQMPVPVIDVFKFGYQVCEAFLSDKSTRNLMKRGNLDLLILDGAYPECALGLAYHFRIPYIYINTVGFYTGSLSTAGNPVPYSVSPYLGLPYSDNMNVVQRLVNSMYHIGLASLHAIMVRFFLDRVLRQYIHPNIPSAYELSKNVSLILQNGHFAVTYPRPYLPTVVEVACLHCRRPKPLPNDLEEFVGGGEGVGFVYVSMGSSVRASNMPSDLRALFVNVFRLLPYQVLWKWESNDTIQGLPRNVRLASWFPQQDLLGHPKIKAFVSHGGLLSLFETAYHGVPVVALPVFCDHDSNVEKANVDGYAIRLEWTQLTGSKLLLAIEDIVTQSKYRKNAKKRSKLLTDQLESPLKRATYWTEYVLRHKGAYHMQSPAKEMSIWQYYLMDVALLFITLLAATLFIIYSTCRFLLKRVFLGNYKKLKIL